MSEPIKKGTAKAVDGGLQFWDGEAWTAVDSPTPVLKPVPPVKHLSYSALYTYFKSPKKFFDSYIARTDKFENNLTLICGKAWHKGLEAHYKGMDEPIQHAVTLFHEQVLKLEEGKRDLESEEKEFDRLVTNLELYFAMPKNWKAGSETELSVTCESPIEGSLPLKGQMDQLDNGTGIVDHKYVNTFAAKDTEFHYVQAFVYYHLYFKHKGFYPTHFRISEWKKSKNRDGSPQLQEIVIVYDPSWLHKVLLWYRDVCTLLSYQRAYPANPFQMFDGDDWKDYLHSKL